MTDLPATAAPSAVDNFRVGGVFGRAFGILGRNALVFIPLGALAALATLLEQRFTRAGVANYSGASAGLGLLALLAVAGAIAETILPHALAALGGPMAGTLGVFFWRACINTCAAIVAVVAYHDLRVAKEGVDIERIAAVFD
jgi:hypothetical protein